MDLVTGATGYVGGRLVDRLRAEGREVRALSRRATALPGHPEVQVVVGDLLAGEGIDAALEGCGVAYYLVHSMEAGAGSAFAERDRRAARRFAAAAAAAGVQRVVYLGGILPDRSGPLSPHLASRFEVEQILMAGDVPTTALRASIVVGAGSASFRILVKLVERMRILPLPAWRSNRTQPIAERDVIECLVRAPRLEAVAGESLDVAGPDVLSYGEMLTRLADQMGVGRMPVGLGASLTPPASAIVSVVTGQPLELVRPLMESLGEDLLPREPDVAERVFGLQPLTFDRAVIRALGEWESREELAAR